MNSKQTSYRYQKNKLHSPKLDKHYYEEPDTKHYDKKTNTEFVKIFRESVKHFNFQNKNKSYS